MEEVKGKPQSDVTMIDTSVAAT